MTSPPTIRTLGEVKQMIWERCAKNPVNVQVAADKAGVRLPITQVDQAEKLWKALNKPNKQRAKVDQALITRYQEAHKVWFADKYPAAWKDGHYPGMEPTVNDTGTSNGLTGFICNYLEWVGCRATRINVQGRMLKDGTRIHSSTRKGTADISSTIRGKSVMWEIKVGRDRPSPEQLKEQAKERKAGGEYLFTHTVEEFFEQYDKLLLVVPEQGFIFTST